MIVQTKFLKLFILVIIIVIIIFRCFNFNKTEYQPFLTSVGLESDSTLPLPGGITDALIDFCYIVGDFPTQLMNGPKYQILKKWSDNCTEQDLSVIGFTIQEGMAQNADSYNYTTLSENAAIKACNAISNWWYSCDRSGPVALKIYWRSCVIEIDKTKLEGQARLGNLLKGAVPGFNIRYKTFSQNIWNLYLKKR
jgi:hypothetical protein